MLHFICGFIGAILFLLLGSSYEKSFVDRRRSRQVGPTLLLVALFAMCISAAAIFGGPLVLIAGLIVCFYVGLLA